MIMATGAAGLSGSAVVSRGMPQIEVTFDIDANARMEETQCTFIEPSGANCATHDADTRRKGRKERMVSNCREKFREKARWSRRRAVRPSLLERMC